VTANAAQSRAGGGCQAQQRRLVLRVVDSAMLGAVAIALDHWEESDGKRDLIGLIDEALDSLAAAMRAS
jgi:hypothetical protein